MCGTQHGDGVLSYRFLFRSVSLVPEPLRFLWPGVHAAVGFSVRPTHSQADFDLVDHSSVIVCVTCQPDLGSGAFMRLLRITVYCLVSLLFPEEVTIVSESHLVDSLSSVCSHTRCPLPPLFRPAGWLHGR